MFEDSPHVLRAASDDTDHLRQGLFFPCWAHYRGNHFTCHSVDGTFLDGEEVGYNYGTQGVHWYGHLGCQIL